MKLTFLISQKAGMTRALARKVAVCGGIAKLSVLVEGPYGQHFPVHRYETVCLLAGGSGITSILSYLCHLRHLAEAGDKTLRTRRVEVVWIAKDRDFIDGVLRNELTNLVGLAGRELDVGITVYLTRESLAKEEKIEGTSSSFSSTGPDSQAPSKAE